LGYEQNSWSAKLGTYSNFSGFGNVDDANGTLTMTFKVEF